MPMIVEPRIPFSVDSGTSENSVLVRNTVGKLFSDDLLYLFRGFTNLGKISVNDNFSENALRAWVTFGEHVNLNIEAAPHQCLFLRLALYTCARVRHFLLFS